MERETVRLRAGGHGLSGVLTRARDMSQPLVVALHGAAYDARYFDVPGRSVHEQAHAAGVSVLSVTRPGYPATEETAAAQPGFAGTAAILDTAVGDAWRRFGRGHPGVVLVGHSVGAALSVHIASRRPAWPLLGLAVSGVGDRPAKGPAAMFGGMPRDRVLDMPFNRVSGTFYSPEALVDPAMNGVLADLLVPFPSADVVEVNTDWCTDLPRVASGVGVPVHHTLAEQDGLWQVDDDASARVGRYFGSSPRVVTQVFAGAGHNIEHHPSGHEYVGSVLSFTRSCVR